MFITYFVRAALSSHVVMDLNTLVTFGAESKLLRWSCSFMSAPICYRFISAYFSQRPFSHIPLACVRVHIFTGLQVYIVVRVMITVLLSDTSVWKTARSWIHWHPTLASLSWDGARGIYRIVGWVDPIVGLDSWKKGRIFLSFLGMEPWCVICPAHSILTMQSQFILSYEAASKTVALCLNL